MLRGLYTSATGMLSQGAQQNVIANNLANVTTPGFKRDVVCFEEFSRLLVSRINETPRGISKVGPIGPIGMGVSLREVRPIFEEAPIVDTGNPLELAISGDAFFVVSTPEGEAYTRNGSFTLDGEGYLVTREGYRVMGEEGPIRLGSQKVWVREDGSIFEERLPEEVAGEPVARIRVVTFPNPAGLAKRGDSLFVATLASGAPLAAGATIRQGYLETSGVEPILEMVRMLECFRAYEANQKAIAFQDETLERLINEGGRV